MTRARRGPPAPSDAGDAAATPPAGVPAGPAGCALVADPTPGDLILAAALDQAFALLADGEDEPEVVRGVLSLLVEQLGYDRGSLIASVETSQLAYVLSATDDPSLTEFCLEVASYPEIGAAVRGGQPLFIADTHVDPLTEPVRDSLIAAQVRALAVFPIVSRRRGLGVVLLRGRGVAAPPTTNGLVVGRVVAAQLGLHLRDSQVIERLRDETRKISRASYEAERRLRTIDSLKEHFEASADGVFVVDEDGGLVFVNGAAVSITGFARERLIGTRLADLVTEEQRGPLAEVVAGVLGGTNLEGFDLNLFTTSGRPIVVSVATSTVLARSGAAIFSFRDVTSERVLEGQLSQTKDFLEKLIDSTVDAIIAADLAGNIILFNPGAERLTGWRADEVIGVKPVEGLYPDGVARRVMRMLRSTAYGGVGRLEQTRHELRSKAGGLVPVNMTASIIYDQGQEAATVGIFSDLRDRIRIEQRLIDAQERLEVQEREAMVAQLAGAAAHELNQPLTSIMGYGELIARRAEPDAPYRRALDVILSEAGRMAGIVKKIGQITKYETKEYVGSASIMDLDRSAPIAGGPPEPEPTSLLSVTDDPFSSPVPVLDEVEDEPTSRIRLDEVLGKKGESTARDPERRRRTTGRHLEGSARPEQAPPEGAAPAAPATDDGPAPGPEPDTAIGHHPDRGRTP